MKAMAAEAACVREKMAIKKKEVLVVKNTRGRQCSQLFRTRNSTL
jgi:hypothetical protein